MKRLVLGLGSLAAAACVHNAQYSRPASPASLTTNANGDDAWLASLQAISDATIPIAGKDRNAGTITTQWQETFTQFAASSPPTRRIQFQISVDGGVVTVMPRPQVCVEGSCRATDDLTVTEAALSDKLESSIQARLQQIPGSTVTRGDVALQSGRDADSPPQVSVQIRTAPQQQPEPRRIFIRTRRAGLQEVAPGRDIEVDLTQGNRVTGKILEASPDAIKLDVGVGTPLVIHAEDIAQINFL